MKTLNMERRRRSAINPNEIVAEQVPVEWACKTCKFWAPRAKDVAPNTVGECRRFAPKISDKPGLSDLFTVVRADVWCGDWQASEETMQKFLSEPGAKNGKLA